MALPLTQIPESKATSSESNYYEFTGRGSNNAQSSELDYEAQAAVFHFLAADDSSYVNGQAIRVDGGRVRWTRCTDNVYTRITAATVGIQSPGDCGARFGKGAGIL